MTEFGSMQIADSLKADWVDGEGKSIMTGKHTQGAISPVKIIHPEQQFHDRLVELEAAITLLRNSLIELSDKVLSLEFPLQDEPQSVKKIKKVKK